MTIYSPANNNLVFNKNFHEEFKDNKISSSIKVTPTEGNFTALPSPEIKFKKNIPDIKLPNIISSRKISKNSNVSNIKINDKENFERFNHFSRFDNYQVLFTK